MPLLTHMLIMLSCAVTSTIPDNIGRDHYSLHAELHALRTAPLSRLLADAVHEKLHPDLGLWRGSDSLRTHHTSQPARNVEDPAPEKLRCLAKLRSLAQLRSFAQLRTAGNPGKPAGNRGEPAGNPGEPVEPVGRIAVNEMTRENIDYASNFAA
jgi:hypothetical protein